jgi:hypothetical protein
MELKRIRDAAGRVVGVRVKETGSTPLQNWASRQVEQYVAEGWMAQRGDTLVITDEDGTELVYDINRRPGYYCASTGDRIPISEMAMLQFMTQPVATLAPAEARAWLAAKGRPENGYLASRNYECALREDAHEKYRAVVDPKGRVVAAHRMEG